MSARRNRGDSSDEESSDEEDLLQQQSLAAAPAGGRTNASTLDQLKREKRLAMNRESARARRRRKKIRLETLEQQAEDLSQKHHSLVMTNQSLKSRVVNLENELATAGGTGRAAVGVGGSMDASSILGAGGLGRAAGGLGQGAAGLRASPFAADRRQAAAAAAGLGGSFADQRASLAATMAGLGAGSAAGLAGSSAAAAGLGGSSAFAGMGMGGMLPSSDPEMQYLQMQQRLLSSQAGTTADASAGSGTSAAARLMALEEMQRRNQLATARGGIGAGGGQMSDLDLLNQQRLPGLRDVSRLRAAQGISGASMLDLGALTPADAAARLAQEANNPQAGASGLRRDPKTELYERLTDTSKKLPPRGSS